MSNGLPTRDDINLVNGLSRVLALTIPGDGYYQLSESTHAELRDLRDRVVQKLNPPRYKYGSDANGRYAIAACFQCNEFHSARQGCAAAKEKDDG